MSALLPTAAAKNIVGGITEYLSTTVGLADKQTADAFAGFLQQNSLFRGPYVRTRMPFQPAESDEPALQWMPDWFHPYVHQAQAFRRLRSAAPDHSSEWQSRTPEPTLVVTGTGSGKTEAFLYPLIDHCRRAKAHGEEGIKAIILYPMNALANDQASRLAKLLNSDDRLAEVTAGIYTGEHYEGSSAVEADSLITDRATLRETPPDILLTNYKMLDQLLMRAADQKLWEVSADSLQYVVLDEAHSYDGAQGTDVAMLLRRLGLKLKSYLDNDSGDTPPLGRITPVATSATIGNEDKPEALLNFIEAVFGVRLSPEAVIRESRLSVEAWAGTNAKGATTEGSANKAAEENFALHFPWASMKHPVQELVHDIEAATEANPAAYEAILGEAFGSFFQGLLTEKDVLDAFFDLSENSTEFQDLSPEAKLNAAKENPWVLQMLFCTEQPDTLESVAARFFGLGSSDEPVAVAFVTHMLSWLSSIRAELATKGVIGRQFPNIDVHLWVRELSRIDRAVATTPAFRWSDDGVEEAISNLDASPSKWLPAIYCRNCNRSGWMIQLEAATRVPVWDPATIRSASVGKDSRGYTRPLILETDPERLRQRTTPAGGDTIGKVYWLNIAEESFVLDDHFDAAAHDHAELAQDFVPVRTYLGQDAADQAEQQVCPACGASDSIRYIGSAVSTLLSVAVSNLFGLPGVDAAEKKALVFTDSVQDAAHRAGFVEARAHAFSLRTDIAAAIYEAADEDDATMSLEQLPKVMLQRARTADEKFQLLPPDINRAEWVKDFYMGSNAKAREKATRIVGQRTAFDVGMEFGRRSEVGRTLLLTGVAFAEVAANDEELLALGRKALQGLQHHQHGAVLVDEQATGGDALGVKDSEVLRWVRGVLERIRSRGGISHPWLTRFREYDGNLWHLNRNQPEGVELPKFAPNSNPRFPRTGPKLDRNSLWLSGTDPVSSPKDWYARWSVQALGIGHKEFAAKLCGVLLKELVAAGILDEVPTQSSGNTYGIPPRRVNVGKLATPRALYCELCLNVTPAGPNTFDQLLGAPCFNLECSGHLSEFEVPENYYRTMYTTTNRKAIVAREHTSLLENERRTALERDFRGIDGTQQPGAVNVLVATPTLEMGIDIGDLSAVLLSSMPRSVANYVQRVGRAGRLTGNALNIAIVRGRGEHLPKIHDPLSVIDGEVTPPNVFLSAREILRRQAFAAMLDALAKNGATASWGRAEDVFSQAADADQVPGALREDGPLVQKLVHAGAAMRDVSVEKFLDSFGGLLSESAKQWVREYDYVDAARSAQQSWKAKVDDIGRKIFRLQHSMDALSRAANAASPSSEDKSAEQLARSTMKLLRQEQERLLREPWIASLERMGLLPNYTLLDDAVELNVSTIRRKKDSTVEFREGSSYRRGAAVALHELAPGSVFYAEGMTINIDAVDLGRDGDKVVAWRLCPSCSYCCEDFASLVGSACPMCGDGDFGGVEQAMPVVPLESVSAQVRLEQDIIDGSHEQRMQKRFTTHVSAAWKPEDATSTWAVKDSEFGVLGLDAVQVRWLNLGAGTGAERILSGERRKFPLFTLCEHCGQVDSEANTNRPKDHRGWCKHRNAAEQHNVTLALGRTLETQGALLYLPDALRSLAPLAIPSLLAALRLGFREVFGGSPQNLDIQVIQVPRPGANASAGEATATMPALLLHDSVPGGTGYLSGFSDPAQLWQLIHRAYEVVSNCECQHTTRMSCPKCLLPFSPMGQIGSTSRSTAALALRMLLLSPEAARDDQTPLPDFESALVQAEITMSRSEENDFEQRTKNLITEAMVARGWKATAAPNGKYIDTVFSKAEQPVQWRLSPQARLTVSGVSTKPDYLLESTAGANLPRFAIYCDSKEYHASIEHPTVLNDAKLRHSLRLNNYVPWAITWSDTMMFVDQSAASKNLDYTWWMPKSSGRKQIQQKLKLSEEAFQRLGLNPIELLIEVVNDPGDHWMQFADSAAMAFGFLEGSRTEPLDSGLGRRWVGEFLDIELEKVFPVLQLQQEPASMAVSLQLEVAPEEGEAFQQAWRRWLALSNWLSLRTNPPSITATAAQSVEYLDADTVAATEDEVAGVVEKPEQAPIAVDVVIPAAWHQFIEVAVTPAEAQLLQGLANTGVDLPEQGLEFDGVPADLAWEPQRFIFSTDPDEDFEAQQREGWTVLHSDADELAVGTIETVLEHLKGN